jgi:DNA polymerase III gamma/tau subunit
MLDQLVAFCGEKIAEADVLNVFGLTSEFTVAQFTEQMLRGATVEALDLLHAEADKGKDMMKLMSDLIVHLRDLLVFKVKPDAISDEVDPDLQKCFERAAELVETERLLELIDQFAAAEGRMKWAPNKKLHFEVAVIKAIQTLNQVTLNQVIENLSALRDGNSVATPAARPAPKPVAPTATAGPKAATPEPQNGDVDPNGIWMNAVEQIAKRRPLIRPWVEAATPLGAEGRFLLLGFPPEQKSAMESLSFPRNRDFLESLLKELSGRDLKVKLVVKEGLPPPKQSEPAAEETAPPAKKSDPQAHFKDDALIREALDIFKGEIKPVTE